MTLGQCSGSEKGARRSRRLIFGHAVPNRRLQGLWVRLSPSRPVERLWPCLHWCFSSFLQQLGLAGMSAIPVPNSYLWWRSRLLRTKTCARCESGLDVRGHGVFCDVAAIPVSTLLLHLYKVERLSVSILDGLHRAALIVFVEAHSLHIISGLLYLCSYSGAFMQHSLTLCQILFMKLARYAVAG